MGFSWAFGLILVVLFGLHSQAVAGNASLPAKENSTDTRSSLPVTENIIDSRSEYEKYAKMTEDIQKNLQRVVKFALKSFMPTLVKMNEVPGISNKCIGALMKYMKGLTQGQVWAAKMIDATSKLPPGVLRGTVADYGSFDQCLEIEGPTDKEGRPAFLGSACALEIQPPRPPMSPGFSAVMSTLPQNNGTLAKYLLQNHDAIHNTKFRLLLCVPSTCSAHDLQLILGKVEEESIFHFKIPQCYTKGAVVLSAIQVAVITALSILLIMCIIGTVIDCRDSDTKKSELGVASSLLVAFSLPDNARRLFSSSGGSAELRCIHGLRALSMCWIILCHTYALMDFEVLKDVAQMQHWFGSLDFEIIQNGWLSVEIFFVISGTLVVYGGFRAMEKTKGRLNIPLMIIRRYIRLVPSLLLAMGLMFMLSLLSHGIFWYELVGTQVNHCTEHWWKSLLFISNWFGIEKGCNVTTWYLPVDFQLHIVALFLLVVLFRYRKFGLILLVACVLLSCIVIAVQTQVHGIMPAVMFSASNEERVLETLDYVHVNTFTHLGPFCIGMLLGYLLIKMKERKIPKPVLYCGWILSIVLASCSLFGVHRMSTGEENSRAVMLLYASLHRCAFVLAVSWVCFVCVAGRGGPVNAILSCSVLVPASRLTFMVYLLHPLVIWTRYGSLRDRMADTHYDHVYAFLGHTVVSFAVAVPFYLLLEAPLSNIDRVLCSPKKSSHSEGTEKSGNKKDNHETNKS